MVTRLTPTEAKRYQRAARQHLEEKAFNRTPPGIPLDEWNKMQNAQKRQRRARRAKGMR